jgi:6-phosphogluconate dehydrogenase
MGVNLARNAARNGARVAVFNRTKEKLDAFMAAYGKEGEFVACRTLTEVAKALRPPRPILLMVKAGEAVDGIIDELLKHIQKGDVLIDGGNSHYRDTERRDELLRKKGIHFLGLGISGGEEGALLGPSLMPGGSKEAYRVVEPLLLKMAAHEGEKRAKDGRCVSYLGPGGSGHFVKMVHNGIEYGVMQLLAETYHLLRKLSRKSNAAIAGIVETWNRDPWLQSFLLEITQEVLLAKDSITGHDLLDSVQDTAGQKGTGKWSTAAAMEYGVSIPTMTAAVDARIISSAKQFREAQAKRDVLTPLSMGVPKDFTERVRTALECSVLNTYAQGFQLLSVASVVEEWNLNLAEIARVWTGGCIIRASFLTLWQKMLSGDNVAAREVRSRFSPQAQRRWRSVVSIGGAKAVPLPAMGASLWYYDSYRTARLPQNLTALQRDCFGAHGYERGDMPGMFHTDWARS